MIKGVQLKGLTNWSTYIDSKKSKKKKQYLCYIYIFFKATSLLYS